MPFPLYQTLQHSWVLGKDELWKVTWPLHLEDEGTGPENYFFQQATSRWFQKAASALERHGIREKGGKNWPSNNLDGLCEFSLLSVIS